MIIKTERLILRPWRKEDFVPFAAMNADKRVMEHFPSTLTSQESDEFANRIMNKLNERGWGLWAVSVPGEADFIGYVGLNEPAFAAHFTPAVEIGWRLASEYWGKGYATEGAKAVLKHSFEVLNLDQIVSFTVMDNNRSRSVMEKIGMQRYPADDFDHPKLPEAHPLRVHVLYRLSKEEWWSLNQKH